MTWVKALRLPSTSILSIVRAADPPHRGRRPFLIMIVSLDFETFSFADIRATGTVRYCADPTTEVLCLSMAVDDNAPISWLPPHLAPIWGRDQREAEQLLASLPDFEEIHAFNALFEITIFKHKFPDLKIPNRLWRCTQALGRRSGYPDTLAKASEMSGGQLKDAEGGRLIRKFCVPIAAGKRKGERRMPGEDPEDFDKIIDYCEVDVIAERDLYEKCKPFEFKNHVLDASFDDLELNLKGIPIDIPAVERAIELRAESTAALAIRFEEVVGCRPSQRQQCVDWFQDQGYGYTSLDEEHVTRELEVDKSMNKIGLEMMELRFLVAGAAHAKLDRMLDMAGADHTVKGGFKLGGAAQTLRWSGVSLQPQNMKKPGPHMDTAGFFKMIQDGSSLEEIELVHGPYMPNLCGSIRHFIKGPFLSSDYNAIEARILAWLAGQTDLVAQFRDGLDPYKEMAAVIYNRDASTIGKPSPERDLGKATVLAAGFGMGEDKFLAQNESEISVPGTEAGQVVEHVNREGREGFLYQEAGSQDTTFAPDRETLEKRVVLAQRKALASKAINAYREKNDKIANYSRGGRWQLGLWGHVEATALKAMKDPGKWHIVPSTQGRIAYQYRDVRGTRYLLCRLPSGRSLCYMSAKVSTEMTSWGKEKEGISYYAKSKFTNYMWKRVYGGLLVENCVQAIAADVMMVGLRNLTAEGFDVRMLIHDEAVAIDDGREPAEMERVMCLMPEWAKGLPLAAEAERIPYYKK